MGVDSTGGEYRTPQGSGRSQPGDREELIGIRSNPEADGGSGPLDRKASGFERSKHRHAGGEHPGDLLHFIGAGIDVPGRVDRACNDVWVRVGDRRGKFGDLVDRTNGMASGVGPDRVEAEPAAAREGIAAFVEKIHEGSGRAQVGVRREHDGRDIEQHAFQGVTEFIEAPGRGRRAEFDRGDAVFEIVEHRRLAHRGRGRLVPLPDIPPVGDAMRIDGQDRFGGGRGVQRLNVEATGGLVHQHLLEGAPLEHAVDGVAPVVLGGRDPVEPEPVVVRHRRSAYADDVLVPKSTIRLRSPPWLHHPESA